MLIRFKFNIVFKWFLKGGTTMICRLSPEWTSWLNVRLFLAIFGHLLVYLADFFKLIVF